jgi:AbrB family looped-hinge helix DNA binding protein
MKTTVTKRGQMVVPAKIRRDHGIVAHTRLEWIDDGHSIRVVPVPDDPIQGAIGITLGLGRRLLEERKRARARG